MAAFALQGPGHHGEVVREAVGLQHDEGGHGDPHGQQRHTDVVVAFLGGWANFFVGCA